MSGGGFGQQQFGMGYGGGGGFPMQNKMGYSPFNQSYGGGMKPMGYGPFGSYGVLAPGAGFPPPNPQFGRNIDMGNGMFMNNMFSQAPPAPTDTGAGTTMQPPAQPPMNGPAMPPYNPNIFQQNAPTAGYFAPTGFGMRTMF